MKYIILSIIALGAVIVLLACKTRKNTTDTMTKTKEQVPLISFSKGSCRGKCKVFKMLVHDNKTVHFEGTKNVENIGTFQAQLNEEQYENLVNIFKTNDFITLETDYISGTKDLQKIEIAYQGKTVKFHKRKAPESLVNTMNKLDELITQITWSKM